MRLVILDTDALIHRAYHALPPLSSQKGEPTNAIYGFFSIFIKMVQTLKPDYIIAALDTPAPTFRKQAFENYKAHRPKTPDDLVSQLQKVKGLLGELGILTLAKDAYEADDIIGTVVYKLQTTSYKLETVIVTGDLDTLQLIREGVKVYTMKRGMTDTVIYDATAVRARFGLEPTQLPDYKGLVGDQSDNIPGVSGVGPKTASSLLQKFQNLETLFKSKDLPEKLKGKKDQALFSKELATITAHAPVSFKLESAQWKGFDLPLWEKYLAPLGFSSLLRRMSLPSGGSERQESLFLDKTPQVKANSQEEPLTKIALWLLNPELKNPEPREPFASVKVRLQSSGLLQVFEEIEAPLVPILDSMQRIGIRVNSQALKVLEEDITKEAQTVRQEMFRLAGEEFNPASPDQLRTLFFEKLKLPVAGIRKTPGGKISTQESELIKLARHHEIIPYILKHRELEKLLTTYLRPLYEKIAPDGRVHTTFIQTGTATGRLASQNPNLQNIPAQGEWSGKVKNLFIADEGFSFASFDYSQIELRVAAHLADDSRMKDAFAKGEDIHTRTAAEVFGVSEDKVTPVMRRMAKVFNFGILYGLSAHGLAQNLQISREEAQEFIDNYFHRFSGVKRYIERMRSEVVAKGYLTTLFGRKRFFEELRHPERLAHNVREAMFREAINFPIQGTATADIIKIAMIRVTQSLNLLNPSTSDNVRLLLQIHDDLLFEIRESELTRVVPRIEESMEHAAALSVPLKVEVKIGKKWGNLEAF